MQLPKNITQIGETNPHCKIYVEDYVISYIKQLNRYACDKELAVALYGVRKEEAGVTYLFFYGACKMNFLQRECRHLSQAVQQEAEKQRKRYFPEYIFLGYRLLNGEMVEGFHVCEQGVCRYIEGYAQFYEKNDSMLAYMVDERQGEAKPEEFNQEKYDMVRKRQEERRALSEEKGGHAFIPARTRNVPSMGETATGGTERLRRMKYSAAAVFALLCVTGLAVMSNGGLGELRTAADRFLDDFTRRQLPDDGQGTGRPEDSVPVSNGSVQVGTIVAEDKLNDAILKENENAGNAVKQTPPPPIGTEEPSPAPSKTPPPMETPRPTPEVTATPIPEPTAPPEKQPVTEPVSYTIKRGDTLIGICIKKYGSDARVAEVCDLNNISNPDKIKVGQKILLP